MKKILFLGLFLIIISVITSHLFSQEIQVEKKPGVIQVKMSLPDSLDSTKGIKASDLGVDAIRLSGDFKPVPKKAVIYSLIFPGLGQIYNRKYWKLPIIYGGYLGVSYAVIWNGNMHSDYLKAYKDLSLNPEGTTSWHSFVPNYMIESTIANPTTLRNSLKRKKNYFKRNRDLAIIVGVGLYALCIIDAYVDAELYDFDVSPDLSMTVMPVVWGPTQNTSVTFGVQCNITF